MRDTSRIGDGRTGPEESLSIVMAAYREGENLSILLPAVAAAVRSLTPRYEVLVVDAVTPLDDTQAICAANQVGHLRRHPTNDYGDAIRTGIAASQGDFVLIMDADGSHSPGFIQELWDRRHLADVVIASRYVVGGQTDNPQLLVSMSRALNRLFRFVVGFPVLDASNSFRLYRGDLLRGLRLTYQHFDILEEILAELLWGKPEPARVMEVPYHFGRRLAGKSKRNLLVFGLHFCLAALRLQRLRRRRMEAHRRSPA